MVSCRPKAGRDALAKGAPAWAGCARASAGFEAVDRVLEVDQTPIGKTPRSCPATYIGFWDTIRKLFAETLEAKARGYAANRFSFNTGEGRCPSCEGQGMRTIAMAFLPDVKVLCEKPATARASTPRPWPSPGAARALATCCRWRWTRRWSSSPAMPSISHPLQLLKDVGLGYLTLGQPSPRSERRRGAAHQAGDRAPRCATTWTTRGQKAPHTLYVLDEPTVGLHMADVESSSTCCTAWSMAATAWW